MISYPLSLLHHRMSGYILGILIVHFKKEQKRMHEPELCACRLILFFFSLYLLLMMPNVRNQNL